MVNKNPIIEDEKWMKSSLLQSMRYGCLNSFCFCALLCSFYANATWHGCAVSRFDFRIKLGCIVCTAYIYASWWQFTHSLSIGPPPSKTSFTLDRMSFRIVALYPPPPSTGPEHLAPWSILRPRCHLSPLYHSCLCIQQNPNKCLQRICNRNVCEYKVWENWCGHFYVNMNLLLFKN